MEVLNSQATEDRIISTSTEVVACINCSTPVSGNFCSGCGQRKEVQRISWKSLLQEFTIKWFGLDNKFARTFLALNVSPGKLVHQFLQGNRVVYMGPLAYYIIVTALIFLLISALDINMREFLQSNQQALGLVDTASEKQNQKQAEVMTFIANSLRLLAILIAPFYALASFIMYRKKGNNFLEHLVIAIYALGHMYWLTLIQVFAFLTTGGSALVIVTMINFLYCGYYYAAVFEEKKKLVSFLKGFIIYFLGVIFFMMFTMLLGLLVALFIKYFLR